MAEVSSVGIVVPGSVRENVCRGGVWYFGYSILPIGVILDIRAEMEMSPTSGAAETDTRLIRALVRTEKNRGPSRGVSLADCWNGLEREIIVHPHHHPQRLIIGQHSRRHQTPALTTDTQSYCM